MILWAHTAPVGVNFIKRPQYFFNATTRFCDIGGEESRKKKRGFGLE